MSAYFSQLLYDFLLMPYNSILTHTQIIYITTRSLPSFVINFIIIDINRQFPSSLCRILKNYANFSREFFCLLHVRVREALKQKSHADEK